MYREPGTPYKYMHDYDPGSLIRDTIYGITDTICMMGYMIILSSQFVVCSPNGRKAHLIMACIYIIHDCAYSVGNSI